MQSRRSFLILIICVVLASCGLYREPYELQSKAGDIGDAMEHCRGFIKYTLHEKAYIYVDSRSSRETKEYYDIFLHLQDSEQEGFAQCRVNKQGLITYHSIREFGGRGRSFSGE
ncbi:MAG: hypothetical protein ACI910_000160 [Oleispira sp.]|jgi:hypothetical protein